MTNQHPRRAVAEKAEAGGEEDAEEDVEEDVEEEIADNP